MINGCLNMDSRDVAKLDFVNVVWDGIVQVEDGLERHMNQDRVGDGNNDNTEEEKDDNDDDDEVVF
ncbi:hypothetical protein EUX98_g6031 [Antrodiella citrinella]|uniref:Uncharacterized protein n=1 Tax=Antrodiella citrinella TaxID=2447956 RepID=A0A4S4MQ11_9APHY|nr:hypothetical protein EUX98_g6031 [Antrodiella citrinella]